MKVYIAGPVTGIENYKEKFQEAEDKLLKDGFEVYNPAKIMDNMPDCTTYEEYMKMGFCLIDMVDAIYMLDGWRNSQGATRELNYALGHVKKIVNIEVVKNTIDKELEDNSNEKN